jgi:hypothetical protein
MRRTYWTKADYRMCGEISKTCEGGCGVREEEDPISTGARVGDH